MTKTSKRAMRSIISLIFILSIFVVGKQYVVAQDQAIQDQTDLATSAYEELFTDDSMTEIEYNLNIDEKNSADNILEELSEDIDRVSFNKWQDTLDQQFSNQEQAKQALKSLLTKSNHLKEGVTTEDFKLVLESINNPFNKDYQQALVNVLENLEVQHEAILATITELELIEAILKEDNTENIKSYTSDKWKSVNLDIEKIANPSVRKNLANQKEELQYEWQQKEDERIAEEKRLAEEKKKAEEKARKEAEAKKVATQKRNTTNTQSKGNLTNSNNKTSSTSTNNQSSNIGANKIGINGIYKNYSHYGGSSLAKIQSGIDSGLIISSLASFSGTDGRTTYFAGHNPGIMNYMEKNLYVGAIITVTDSSGEEFNYKMIDFVEVDIKGHGTLKSIGRTARDVYNNGTGTESILVQYCNSHNGLMRFWYGVPA